MTEASETVSGPDIYGKSYYACHCGDIPYDRSQPHWGEFFGKIADELVRTFRPRRVFDAGCALGFLVEAFWDRGVVASGRDISEYAISNTRKDIRQYCSIGSLTEPIEGPFDLITCIEVLEHMTEEESMTAIANMTAAADRIVFSSTPTDLTEPTHINVKPPIYWIEAFAAHDFGPLIETTLFSITPYALAFERRKIKPSEDYLHACAEIIRNRLRHADVVHELSAKIGESDRIIASLVADRAGLVAEWERATAERERALDELALANDRCAILQTSLDDLADANMRRFLLIERLSRSGSWRLARELARIARQLRLRGSRTDTAAELLADAKASVLLSFDPDFYTKRYPDVLESGVEPLSHYLHHGMREGRAPSQIALENIWHQKLNADVSLDNLRLSDLCDPEHEECGPKLRDEGFLVTVLTPTFNIEPKYIEELYQTLVNQSYENWEWVVVDDGSSRVASIAILRDIARRDPRVRFFANRANLGISMASNVGLAKALGTHIALVDHDDLVARHAFLSIYQAWKRSPDAQMFYTDECKLKPDGRLSEIWAKPDWSPAYLEYTMYVAHLSVYSRTFLDELGGFRAEFDGTQDYDLALRGLLRDPTVVHVPVFAYLWRIIPGSAAGRHTEKPHAIERQERAVLAYARKRHPDATVVPGYRAGYWRIVYPLTPSPPLLSYIIPAGGGVRTIRGSAIELALNCVRSFENRVFYPNREYIVVHDGSLPAAQKLALSAIPNVRFVVHTEPAFNFSRTVNVGVAAASGEYICLVNDDVEAITERGGEDLVSYLAVNPKVGAIGPKCLFEDGRIQQCGVILLADGPAHAGTGEPRDFSGHHMGLTCRHETYCLGAAMLIMRKAVYEEVGGFREDLPLNYNDVDFSLRVRDRGYTCVVDPAIEVYHFESATKIGTANVEQERMFLTRAETYDPYFSKWFDPESPSFKLDMEAPDRPRPFGSWLDRHIARRTTAEGQSACVKIAICIVATDQPMRILDEAVRSATMQTYTNIQLVVVDAGIREPEVRHWVETLKQRGIATAKMERGCTLGVTAAMLRKHVDAEFVVFLQASDFISVDALQLLAANIEKYKFSSVFYTDHYEADDLSHRQNPFFKPDFDPILLTNLWYLDCMLAVKSDLLWRACDVVDSEPFSSIAYQAIVQCVLEGGTPQHIRELAYGRRSIASNNVRDSADVRGDRRAVARLIEARGVANALTVECHTDGPGSQLRLNAKLAIDNVTVMEGSCVWGEAGFGVRGLRTAAVKSGSHWIAILLEPHSQSDLRHLSAPALFDRRVNAVCGILLDGNDLVHWSGGVFLPGGRVFDPHAGQPIASGGYRGLLSCQRCIDVAAPVNVLVRSEAIIRVADRFAELDADGFMVAIGLDAAERGELVAVTPILTAFASRDMLPPADRQGLVLSNELLQGGSRWYDGRLEIERPFTMPAFG